MGNFEVQNYRKCTQREKKYTKYPIYLLKYLVSKKKNSLPIIIILIAFFAV